MPYIVDTEARLLEIREALAIAEGLPRRGVVVGGPDTLPREWSPGAPGWTENVADIMETSDGKRALEIPPQALKHLDKPVVVRGKPVRIPPAASLKNATRKTYP